jgi:hypothetical protein
VSSLVDETDETDNLEVKAIDSNDDDDSASAMPRLKRAKTEIQNITGYLLPTYFQSAHRDCIGLISLSLSLIL